MNQHRERQEEQAGDHLDQQDRWRLGDDQQQWRHQHDDRPDALQTGGLFRQARARHKRTVARGILHRVPDLVRCDDDSG